MHVSQILRSCICFRISRTFFIHVFSCMYLYMYMYVRTYVYPVCYSNDYEYSPHMLRNSPHTFVACYVFILWWNIFLLFFCVCACMCMYTYMRMNRGRKCTVARINRIFVCVRTHIYVRSKGKRTNSKGNRIRVECKILLPHHKIHEWIFCVYKIVRKSIIKGDAQPGVESKAFYGWSR